MHGNNGLQEAAAPCTTDEERVKVYCKLSPVAQPELAINIPRTQCFQQPLEMCFSAYA